jgi:hypothetical protein
VLTLNRFGCADHLAYPSCAQCLATEQRAYAADWKVVHGRHRSATPEQQGHHTQRLASRFDGIRSELQIACFGDRSEEEPVMVTCRADALAYFCLICLLVVQLMYRYN